MAALLVAQAVLVPAPALATGLTITHTPVSTAYAGDSVPLSWTISGGNPFAPEISTTLHWIGPDGSEKTYSEFQYSSCSVSCNFSHSISGDDVRFPLVHYWITANQQGDSASFGSQAGPTQQVVVSNRIRFRLLKPNGSAAAATPVDWRMDNGLTGGRITTDANGYGIFDIANSDSSLASRAAGPKYADIFFTAFDSWPAQHPQTPTTYSGNGAHFSAVLNLGESILPAVDSATQDQTITLASEIRTDGVAQTSFDQCVSVTLYTVCWKHIEDITSGLSVSAGRNVGAATDFTTNWYYDHSVYSTSEWFYTAGFGWTDAGKEVKNTQDATAGAGGPATAGNNYDLKLKWIFSHDMSGYCASLSACSVEETVTPHHWTGGLLNGNPPHYYPDLHGVDPTSNDCFFDVPRGGYSESAVSAGTQSTNSITIEGSVKAFHATGKWVGTNGTTTGHKLRWNAGTQNRPHVVYVPNGGTTNCPAQDPDHAWTDS